MRENLDDSLKLLFGDEGGYSNVKTDSGGPTKYGITHRTLAAHLGLKSVSAERVKAMTLAEAEAIYRKSYWTQSGGDLLPAGLDYAVFDFGVNSGPARAVKTLQKVLGITQDGIIGVQTVAAAEERGAAALIREYCRARMDFLRSLGGKTGFSANGRGWTIRVTGVDPQGKWKSTPGVIGNALRLAGASPFKINPTDVVDPAGAAKANPKDVSVIEDLKKPEAWGPLGGLIAAIGGFAAGNGPVQWALAAAMLIGVGYGVYMLVQRRKEAG
jgi:lysozyme family protein